MPYKNAGISRFPVSETMVSIVATTIAEESIIVYVHLYSYKRHHCVFKIAKK